MLDRYDAVRLLYTSLRLIWLEHDPRGVYVNLPEDVKLILPDTVKLTCICKDSLTLIIEFLVGSYLNDFEAMLKENLDTKEKDNDVGQTLRNYSWKLLLVFFPCPPYPHPMNYYDHETSSSEGSRRGFSITKTRPGSNIR